MTWKELYELTIPKLKGIEGPVIITGISESGEPITSTCEKDIEALRKLFFYPGAYDLIPYEDE